MKHLLLLVFFLTGYARIQAQTVDSMLIISPGLSPSVVAKGRLELALFNQLSSLNFEQTIDADVFRQRYSSLYHVLQVGYGLDRYNRLNIGASAVFAHNRQDDMEDRSAFAVFQGADAASLVYRNMAAVGLYARAIPVRNLPELTVQAGIFFPTINASQARQASGYDRTFVQLQFAFYQQFSPLFYAFATAGGNLFLPYEFRKQTSLNVPVSLYPVVRLGTGSNTYVFGSFTYTGVFNKVKPGFLRANGYQMYYGLGAQYYFQPDMSIYLQLQWPAAVDLNSPTTEVLRKNTFILGLGARYVI